MAEQSSNNGLAYFIAGLGVGVAVGILIAPRSGAETRRYLRERAEEGGEYVKTKAQEGTEYVRRRGAEARDSASELIDRGKEAVSRQKEQISVAIEAGKQAYRESVAGDGSA
ncbi:MAG: YtxH domain-containing protein [Bryobacteraceae bacterium]